MSRRRGTQHFRSRRQFGRATDPGISFTFACASSEAHIEEAKQASHDLLIRLTAGHRRGGVQWNIWSAAIAPEQIAKIPDSEMWRHHLEYLEGHPDGFLVMALCRSSAMQPVKTGEGRL